MNAPATPAAIAQADFHIVPLASFAPSQTRTQARRRARFTKAELADLAANIKAVGVMQPIVARPHPRAAELAPIKYEIVAGERRWLAAELAGLIEIPAVIRAVADADLITFQLTENLQRKTIDQLEEAEGYNELRTGKKITADQVADLLGVSRSTVFNRLKLLDLCPEASRYLDEGKLQPSIALLIARLPDPKMQVIAAKGCATGKDLGRFQPEETWDGPLTVKDAESYIKEEFTARLDGNAAISRAKAAGRAVIAGKEAAEIWKREHAGPAGHIVLEDYYWSGNQRKQYRAAIGGDDPCKILIQNPFNGAAVECLPREAAITAFKARKLTLPSDLEPRQVSRSNSTPANKKAPEPSPAAKAKAELKGAREDMKQTVADDLRLAVFKAMRSRYPAKLGKPELLNLLAYTRQFGYGQLQVEIAPKPKRLEPCTERQLIGFVLDELFCDRIENHADDELYAAAKRYSVAVDRIRKDLTAAAEEKLEEYAAQIEAKLAAAKNKKDTARMKAKLAKASPLVKKGKRK